MQNVLSANDWSYTRRHSTCSYTNYGSGWAHIRCFTPWQISHLAPLRCWRRPWATPYMGSVFWWRVRVPTIIANCDYQAEQLFGLARPSSLWLPSAHSTRYAGSIYYENASNNSFGSKYLEEDPRTNRIDDSLQLFTHICSHQLLKNLHLVLFLSMTYFWVVKLIGSLIGDPCRQDRYLASEARQGHQSQEIVSE